MCPPGIPLKDRISDSDNERQRAERSDSEQMRTERQRTERQQAERTNSDEIELQERIDQQKLVQIIKEALEPEIHVQMGGSCCYRCAVEDMPVDKAYVYTTDQDYTNSVIDLTINNIEIKELYIAWGDYRLETWSQKLDLGQRICNTLYSTNKVLIDWGYHIDERIKVIMI